MSVCNKTILSSNKLLRNKENKKNINANYHWFVLIFLVMAKNELQQQFDQYLKKERVKILYNSQ